MEAALQQSPGSSDYDLDVSFVEKGTAIAELLNKTSDQCGSTNQSACVTCIGD
ncbi:FxLD family lanthipeptide [Pseudonocardia acaciae]|uniref:FxLD family lanthipeptide n=1 Tax=Pseudonocardia acaciae TaxID=551276 RepID=UPI000A008FF6